MSTPPQRAVVATLLAVLVTCSSWLPTHVTAAEDWLYSVRPGDELWSLAERYCGSMRYTERLARYNNLGTGVLIKPGERIRIPIEWLVRQPADALVISVFGSARLLPGGTPLSVSQRVAMGQAIETQEGTAVVQFADDSVLMIAPQSHVLFNVMTAYGDSGMVDTSLRFYRGRGTSRIVKRQNASKFRVSTPSGTAAVRGTEFRVGVEEARSVTETLTGSVGFIAAVETAVPAGFGLAAGTDGEVNTEPLLAAPTWLTQPATLAVGDGIEWNPLPGAIGYRVRVLRAAAPETVVSESVVEVQRATLDGVAPDTYRIAVRGISESGIEGYESDFEVDVRGAAPEPRGVTRQATGQAVVEWQATGAGAPYLVQVDSADGGFNAASEYSASGTALPLPDLVPGTYQWRVKNANSHFSVPAVLNVTPGPVEALTLRKEGTRLRAVWSVANAAERYRIEISHSADFRVVLVDQQTEQSNFELEVTERTRHFVRVSAVAAGQQGEPTVRDVDIRREPFWLLVALLAVFGIAML